jgi:hypothetical protein
MSEFGSLTTFLNTLPLQGHTARVQVLAGPVSNPMLPSGKTPSKGDIACTDLGNDSDVNYREARRFAHPAMSFTKI